MQAKDGYRPKIGDSALIGKRIIGVGDSIPVYGKIVQIDEHYNYLVEYVDE
jgi:hypothetical protein